VFYQRRPLNNERVVLIKGGLKFFGCTDTHTLLLPFSTPTARKREKGMSTHSTAQRRWIIEGLWPWINSVIENLSGPSVTMKYSGVVEDCLIILLKRLDAELSLLETRMKTPLSACDNERVRLELVDEWSRRGHLSEAFILFALADQPEASTAWSIAQIAFVSSRRESTASTIPREFPPAVLARLAHLSPSKALSLYQRSTSLPEPPPFFRTLLSEHGNNLAKIEQLAQTFLTVNCESSPTAAAAPIFAHATRRFENQGRLWDGPTEGVSLCLGNGPANLVWPLLVDRLRAKMIVLFGAVVLLAKDVVLHVASEATSQASAQVPSHWATVLLSSLAPHCPSSTGQLGISEMLLHCVSLGFLHPVLPSELFCHLLNALEGSLFGTSTISKILSTGGGGADAGGGGPDSNSSNDEMRAFENNNSSSATYGTPRHHTPVREGTPATPSATLSSPTGEQLVSQAGNPKRGRGSRQRKNVQTSTDTVQYAQEIRQLGNGATTTTTAMTAASEEDTLMLEETTQSIPAADALSVPFLPYTCRLPQRWSEE